MVKSTTAPKSFEEFLTAYDGHMQQLCLSSSRMVRKTVVRDILRPLQFEWWKPWVSHHHGGSGDPTLQSAAELGAYLDAICDWSDILNLRRELPDVVRERRRQQCNAALERIEAL